eukprot:CAMPEP_0204903166 /NCGR_PEP_ID=MMETSP1397-20131031/4086_1 /ASSEMBLY_ACC=CAM_ASM_000891 /TAXON_ID=49980 /ORGANISM="Climacostomum Climacostomum virens, Strain Stock W-24" /LENGTH=388 /DNA_ID=CAMNT_0052071755 /DNA_START=568 /DNA_END=1731 /DNA_ORIENTATION=+
MDYLQAEKFPAALGLLKQARSLISDPMGQQKLLAITYNNIGCYYKRLGKNKTALKYLRLALELEAHTAADATNLAGTHLNICAILSKLNQHSKAYQHAAIALSLLSKIQPSASYLSTLIIAFHNAGAELEYLQEQAEALQAYHSGWQIAEKNLGARHALTDSLMRSFTALKSKMVENRANRSRSQMKRKHVSLDFHTKLNKTLPKLQQADLSDSYRLTSTEDSRHKSMTIHSPRYKKLDFKGSALTMKPLSRPKSKENYYSRNAINFLTRPSARGTVDTLNKAARTIQLWWRGLKKKALRRKSPKTKRKISPASLSKINPLVQKKVVAKPAPKKGMLSSLEAKAKSNKGGKNFKIKLIKSRLQGFIANRKINKESQAAIVIQKNVRMW